MSTHVDKVLIDKKELAELKRDALFLELLRQAGVDNWGGYEDALALADEEKLFDDGGAFDGD